MASTVKAPKEQKIDPLTHTTEGTQSHFIAQELVKGGESKRAIAERIRGALPKKTVYDNPNPIDQKVHAVLTKLLQHGFTIEQHYRLVPPTGRAAQRAAKAVKRSGRPKKTAKKVTKKTARKTTKKATKATKRPVRKAAKRPVKKTTKARKPRSQAKKRSSAQKQVA